MVSKSSGKFAAFSRDTVALDYTHEDLQQAITGYASHMMTQGTCPHGGCAACMLAGTAYFVVDVVRHMVIAKHKDKPRYVRLDRRLLDTAECPCVTFFAGAAEARETTVGYYSIEAVSDVQLIRALGALAEAPLLTPLPR